MHDWLETLSLRTTYRRVTDESEVSATGAAAAMLGAGDAFVHALRWFVRVLVIALVMWVVYRVLRLVFSALAPPTVAPPPPGPAT
jgi:multisubunit Na+/H+ antiporter MnhG subunit